VSAGRHLLQIEGMGRADIEALLAAARELKAQLAQGSQRRSLEGKVVANLFFEDSTRTRSSFEIAAKSLGAHVLNLSSAGSSVSKGETLVDTAKNIDAMGVRTIVMRHAASGAPHLVARNVRACVVNAGDGTHEHPSQALLDALTLTESLGTLEGKRVLIVGDILHSRVARSNLFCLKSLGAQVTFCGPPTLLPTGAEALGARVHDRLDEALEGQDAVMLLRVQLERQTESMFPSAREYARLWGMNAARAARLGKGAVVLHPGPVNRGVELSPEVMDGPRSVILQQVANGIAVRMAILERCG
jgi:aspartate carbamoyltransferase catalytic subunit